MLAMRPLITLLGLLALVGCTEPTHYEVAADCAGNETFVTTVLRGSPDNSRTNNQQQEFSKMLLTATYVHAKVHGQNTRAARRSINERFLLYKDRFEDASAAEKQSLAAEAVKKSKTCFDRFALVVE
jgi:hypothetical protein